MRSLKHWLTYNWHLKLISLVLATMLWMMVATEASSELAMEVPLEYRNIPARMEITGDTTNSVQVRLRGSPNVVRDISPKNVSTTIDLSNMRPPSTQRNSRYPHGGRNTGTPLSKERTYPLRTTWVYCPAASSDCATGRTASTSSIQPSRESGHW